MSRIALLTIILLLGTLGASSTAPGADGHQTHRPSSPPVLDFSQLSRSLEASQGIVTMSASPGDNETTFAATLCDSIAANAPVTTLSVFGALSDSLVPYFTLPSCVYDISGTLTVLNLGAWLVNGTASHPDPLTLLGPMLAPNNTAFILSLVHLYGIQPNNLAHVDWTDFVSSYLPNTVQITIAQTKFIGSLPASLPSSCLAFSAQSSSFSGTIPSTMMPLGCSSMQLAIADSEVTGDIPNGFLANVGPNAAFVISIVSNPYLNGTIGSNFLAGPNLTSLVTLTLTLSSNPQLSGTIPNHLWGLPSPCNTNALLVDVGSTNISAFSKTFLSAYSFPQMTSFQFRTINSAIKGDLPSRIMPLSAPKLLTYTLYNDGNVMGGTVPTAFIGNIASWTGGVSPSTTVTLWLQNNQLTGIITFPAAPSQTLGSGPYTLIKFAGQNNSFAYMNIQPTASRYLTDIEIGASSGSRGAIDNAFSPSAIDSYLTVVDFANSSISGVMPDLNTMNTAKIQQLSLSNTQIDFCADTSRSPWTGSSALTTCKLDGTNAYLCPELYPNCELSTTAPTAPKTCLNSTKPNDDFVCIGGIWVNLNSSTTPTLVIITAPSTAGSSSPEVLVLGNVTSSTIMYQGIGTTLVVGGCADNVSSISIELSDEDLKRIASSSGDFRQQLLAIQGDNCSDLSTLSISTSTTNSTCSTVSSSIQTTNGQLFALFSISSNSCTSKKEQRVWIIIVPVICGLVLLIVIIVVIAVAFCDCAKNSVRPYAGADPHPV